MELPGSKSLSTRGSEEGGKEKKTQGLIEIREKKGVLQTETKVYYGKGVWVTERG